MNPGDEALSPTTAPTPPPTPSAGPAAVPPCAPAAAPTAEAVLRWIASGGAEPWFPSAHAKRTGTPRDSLDEPLTELRLAELVKIVAWVRGVGQGYVLTDAGRDLFTRAPAAVPPPEPPPQPVMAPVPPPRPDITEDRLPVVTAALVIANVLWFFVGLVFAMRVGVSADEYLGKGSTTVLERIGGVCGSDLLRGEWWRLATCCFVHIGVMHLLLNMLVLGGLGPLSEALWGRFRTVLIYAVSGLGGSCLAMALRPTADNGAETLLAGASGAIWGLLTALLAWLLVHGSTLHPASADGLFRRLMVMLVVNGLASFLPQISWEGHLGGGVAGLLTAGLLNVARLGDRTRRVAAVVLLVSLPALCVSGLMLVMKTGRTWAVLRERAAQGEEARRELNANDHRRAFNERVTELLPPVVPERAPRPGRVMPAGRLTPGERLTVVPLVCAPRGYFQTAAARLRVAAVRSAAARLEEGMSGPPTGDEEVDRRREQLRAYAAARGRELDLLGAMLAARSLPDVPAWQAWGDARREADRLWDELPKK